nr:uncharacterized protein LOC123479171 [Desmodus rotundus]
MATRWRLERSQSSRSPQVRVGDWGVPRPLPCRLWSDLGATCRTPCLRPHPYCLCLCPHVHLCPSFCSLRRQSQDLGPTPMQHDLSLTRVHPSKPLFQIPLAGTRGLGRKHISEGHSCTYGRTPTGLCVGSGDMNVQHMARSRSTARATFPWASSQDAAPSRGLQALGPLGSAKAGTEPRGVEGGSSSVLPAHRALGCCPGDSSSPLCLSSPSLGLCPSSPGSSAHLCSDRGPGPPRRSWDSRAAPCAQLPFPCAPPRSPGRRPDPLLQKAGHLRVHREGRLGWGWQAALFAGVSGTRESRSFWRQKRCLSQGTQRNSGNPMSGSGRTR